MEKNAHFKLSCGSEFFLFASHSPPTLASLATEGKPSTSETLACANAGRLQKAAKMPEAIWNVFLFYSVLPLVMRNFACTHWSTPVPISTYKYKVYLQLGTGPVAHIRTAPGHIVIAAKMLVMSQCFTHPPIGPLHPDRSAAVMISRTSAYGELQQDWPPVRSGYSTGGHGVLSTAHGWNTTMYCASTLVPTEAVSRLHRAICCAEHVRMPVISCGIT